MSQESNVHELEVLHARVKVVEAEIATPTRSTSDWPPRRFYSVYFALAGFVLGGIGALASLLLNVVISFFVGQHPLHIIQVYLTLALGHSALTMNNGLTLTMGCCFYLILGMVLGIPYHLILSRWFETSSTPVQFTATTLLALSVWIINF